MSPGTPVWLWAIVSAAILAVVVAARVRPWSRGHGEPSLAWFLAGSGSAAMLVLTAAKVIESLPSATALTVGGLSLGGVLTGWFLGVGLTPRERRPV